MLNAQKWNVYSGQQTELKHPLKLKKKKYLK